MMVKEVDTNRFLYLIDVDTMSDSVRKRAVFTRYYSPGFISDKKYDEKNTWDAFNIKNCVEYGYNHGVDVY